MTDIIMVLGADRVGKSTFIENLKNQLTPNYHDIQQFHFSGPRPDHDSPICQYLIPLTSGLSASKMYSKSLHILDRGGSEVCFYEKYRRGIDIDISWAHTFESWITSKYEKVLMVLITRPWYWSKPKHVKEIEQLYPNSSLYWRNSQLRARESEHHAYYDYMLKYAHSQSLISDKLVVIDDNISKQVETVIGCL